MKKATIAATLLAAILIWGTACAATRLAQPNLPLERGPATLVQDEGPKGQRSVPDSLPAETTNVASPDRMVIYTAHLSLEVDNLTHSLDSVARIATEMGGYLANVKREERSGPTATVTLRVPATTYVETLARLRHLASKIVQENSSARDVGEEFSDLAAQLRNLEAAEAQYRELLRRAQTIDEVLKVQQRLDEVRGRIERTQGRLKYLERQAEMATIDLTLSQVPPSAAPWGPAQAAQEAWEASLALGRVVASYGLWALVFGWWLPLPLLAAGLLWRRRRRSPAPCSQ